MQISEKCKGCCSQNKNKCCENNNLIFLSAGKITSTVSVEIVKYFQNPFSTIDDNNKKQINEICKQFMPEQGQRCLLFIISELTDNTSFEILLSIQSEFSSEKGYDVFVLDISTLKPNIITTDHAIRVKKIHNVIINPTPNKFFSDMIICREAFSMLFFLFKSSFSENLSDRADLYKLFNTGKTDYYFYKTEYNSLTDRFVKNLSADIKKIKYPGSLFVVIVADLNDNLEIIDTVTALINEVCADKFSIVVKISDIKKDTDEIDVHLLSG